MIVVELATKELQYWYITPLEEIKGKLPFPKEILKQYKKRIVLLRGLRSTNELKQFKGLNFEKLKGDLKDFCSIRLNDQYRLIFKITESKEGKVKIEIVHVTEISKHYE